MARWRANLGAQARIIRDVLGTGGLRSRFPAIASGFRGGKTWAGSRIHVSLRRVNMCPGLLVAETFQQARQVMIPAVMEAAEEGYLQPLFRPSDMVVIYRALHDPRSEYDQCVYSLVRSADKAERIAGFEVGDFWGDEIGRWPNYPDEPVRDPWLQAVARISDKRAVHACGIATGTHEGKGTRFYRDWVGQPREGHKLYTGSTIDNEHNLRAGYVDTLRSSYDPVLLLQYLFGQASEPSIPLAFYQYGAHNLAAKTYREGAPLCIMFDFNVEPLCSVQGQYWGNPPNGELHIIGETVDPISANTGQLARAIAAKYSTHTGEVWVYGDATGSRRDTRSNTDDWRLVGEAFERAWPGKVRMLVPRSQPAPKDTLARTNAAFLDGMGRTRIFINEAECPVLINDLERVRMKGSDIDKRDPKLTHASDAFRYGCYQLFSLDEPDTGGISTGGERPSGFQTGQAERLNEQFRPVHDDDPMAPSTLGA